MQPGLVVAEEAALRVVRAALHKGQQGASHNTLGWKTQHVTKVPQSALVRRHRRCGSLVLTSDGMQTAAVKTVNHAHGCYCEGPGLTRVR